MHDRVVVTGIGMVTAVGNGRESTWEAVRDGRSGVRRLSGVPGLPDDSMLAATVGDPTVDEYQLRNLPLAAQAAREAIDDSQISHFAIQPARIGCAVSATMGDTPRLHALRTGEDTKESSSSWSEDWHWMPNAISSYLAEEFRLHGPRLCNSTACATGAIATLQAVRAIQDNQCDMALAGAVQTIHPLLAAGFKNMRVLANHEDPTQACRPFDANRSGFVMGEGAAMLMLERLSHAVARRAPIYAEIVGGRLCGDAHHVTDLNVESDTLSRLIQDTLKTSKLVPSDIAYINAHGTGTLQNDVMETRGIRESFGRAADSVCMSSTKAVLGHLVNAAGAVELAISILALRDGFAPPTVNLTDPDPECDLDCIPFVGRQEKFEHALKISIAFGGHLAAIALRRWSDAGDRQAEIFTRRSA
ncbi:MAG: beta-ketoacyl-[acyl-carrier-protein] synthase family protein [Planctomycetes bacterium]|nr:beta-ketoacyl-[acyl-carrier-protein] synthase family protein [Planctomycetota bacterium]